MHCSRRLIVLPLDVPDINPSLLLWGPSGQRWRYLWTFLFSNVPTFATSRLQEILEAKGVTTWARNGRWILPENARLPCNIQGSFTCRKSTTLDRGLYFPSEGRRAEDFLPWKIQRLRSGLNPRTSVPKASTLPLDHWKCETHKEQRKSRTEYVLRQDTSETAKRRRRLWISFRDVRQVVSVSWNVTNHSIHGFTYIYVTNIYSRKYKKAGNEYRHLSLLLILLFIERRQAGVQFRTHSKENLSRRI